MGIPGKLLLHYGTSFWAISMIRVVFIMASCAAEEIDRNAYCLSAVTATVTTTAPVDATTVHGMLGVDGFY